MAGIDPGGVVDAILSSEELQNGLFGAVTASERCAPPVNVEMKLYKKK